MNALCLATKGKICKTRIVERVIAGGGGIVYRDREGVKGKKPTKQECEILYFPKISMDLIEIIKQEEKKFTVIVTFLEAIG